MRPIKTGRAFSTLPVYGLILSNERYWFASFVAGSKGYSIGVEEKVNFKAYLFPLPVGGFLGVFFGAAAELPLTVFLA